MWSLQICNKTSRIVILCGDTSIQTEKFRNFPLQNRAKYKLCRPIGCLECGINGMTLQFNYASRLHTLVNLKSTRSWEADQKRTQNLKEMSTNQVSWSWTLPSTCTFSRRNTYCGTCTFSRRNTYRKVRVCYIWSKFMRNTWIPTCVFLKLGIPESILWIFHLMPSTSKHQNTYYGRCTYHHETTCHEIIICYITMFMWSSNTLNFRFTHLFRSPGHAIF